MFSLEMHGTYHHTFTYMLEAYIFCKGQCCVQKNPVLFSGDESQINLFKIEMQP